MTAEEALGRAREYCALMVTKSAVFTHDLRKIETDILKVFEELQEQMEAIKRDREQDEARADADAYFEERDKRKAEEAR